MSKSNFFHQPLIKLVNYPYIACKIKCPPSDRATNGRDSLLFPRLATLMAPPSGVKVILQFLCTPQAGAATGDRMSHESGIKFCSTVLCPLTV